MAFTNDVSTTSYKVIKYSVLFGAVVGFLILICFSILVHDTYWIQKNPKIFFTETFMMGLLTSIPILYISYVRGATKKQTIEGVALFFLKVLLLHIGFQLSGVYSVIFPESAGA